MESPRPKQQILGKIVSGFVVFCNLAEIRKESTLRICFPEVLDAIDTEWPSFGQLGW